MSLLRTFTLLLLLLGSTKTFAADPQCEGRFVNPITDICWECIFPISIGSVAVSTGTVPDTANPGSPIQFCPMGILYRVGLAIGYWEPMALTDVTRSPYCMVNLGGFNLNVGNVGSGTAGQSDKAAAGAFYHVHWYKYPLTYWLNIITSAGCLQGGDMDNSTEYGHLLHRADSMGTAHILIPPTYPHFLAFIC
ncbi:hypothetical protein RABR111495_24495 [Rahnella bruchi]